MKEEDYMLKKIGTENAFHVPEGYFENLTSEIMNRLPEKEKPASEKKEVTMWLLKKYVAYGHEYNTTQIKDYVKSINVDTQFGTLSSYKMSSFTLE